MYGNRPRSKTIACVPDERTTGAHAPSRFRRADMPKSLSAEHQRELDQLRALGLALIDFFESVDKSFSESGGGRGFREAIELQYRKSSLRGARTMRNELVAMIEAVKPIDRRRLDALLRERVGTSLDDLLAHQLAQIRRIRDRGSIRSDSEYYVVKEHVETIWDDPPRAEDFRVLQEMLAAYESRVRKQRQGQAG
jgi:hypothetical protein